MAEYIDIDKSYDTATLEDWYINSVTDDAPIWTEEHLEELLNDFYVIPKDTPAADVVEVVHAKWVGKIAKICDWSGKKRDYYQPNSCSHCHEAEIERFPFCPNCGAKMDGERRSE